MGQTGGVTLKDPAFLFYTSDFLTGTMLMTNEQVGKYIRLLCLQHQKGHLSDKDMLIICVSHDEDIYNKFDTDAQGKYYNKRLDDEKSKRIAYSESRSKNRKGSNASGKRAKKHMSNTCESYVPHMEDENVNVNIDKRGAGGKQFSKPTVDDVRGYCTDRKNPINPQKFVDYYESNGWMVGRNKMKDWKAAVRSWENRQDGTKDVKPKYELRV